ncbi:DUF1349 domain-containing protein [Candidatus Sumerlaeota bacterium]|nr:DUF1349 domain-containing protein [Candidatus Sumerlaeota bacterium]
MCGKSTRRWTLHQFRRWPWIIIIAFIACNPPQKQLPLSPPDHLTTSTSAGKMVLQWDHPASTAAFGIKRAMNIDGPYETIATKIYAKTYTDASAAAGIWYHYKVWAEDITGKSPDSIAASGALMDLSSAPWLTSDIGAVGAVGSFKEFNHSLTIEGSGSDIWNSSDEFRYVYKTLHGDFTLTVRVRTMRDTAPWAKAGIMIRETLDAQSKYALCFVSPRRGISFQQRGATGQEASEIAGKAGWRAPCWLRLSRKDDMITAACSSDGSQWLNLGARNIPMTKTLYAGLAVCSVNDGVICQAEFDNVDISLTMDWLTSDIGAAGAPGSFLKAGEVFTIEGSGSDIWNTSDDFRFVYQTTSGDFSITARVLNLRNTAPWAKAGVMIRENLDAQSKYALCFVSPEHGTAFQQRSSPGVQANGIAEAPEGRAPYWVRLERKGNQLTAFCSADASQWKMIGSRTISFSDSVYAGLAVCSVHDGVLCQAQFDNVTIHLIRPMPNS